MSASDDKPASGATPDPGVLAFEGDPEVGLARPDAFISYRRIRADMAFVDQLQEALAERGKHVWVDRTDIEPAADWSERITRAIEASKAFIFVITPESVLSEECRNELEIASQHHKLIIPVVFRDVDRRDLPDSLSRPNWIFFNSGHDAGRALDNTVVALEEDLDWRDGHTRLAVRTQEWANAQRDRSFLLRGSDLRQAQDWLSQGAVHEKTPPTALQTDYILASHKAAARTQRTWRTALAIGLAVSLGLATLAFLQRQQARDEARLADSRALAAEATADLSTNPGKSLGLALDSTKTDPNGTAEQALRLALAQAHMRMVIRTGMGSNTYAAWNPSRAQVAVTAPHGSVALWDTSTGRLSQTLPVAHSARVTQLLYDLSGSRLAAVSSAGYVSMWNISANGRASALSTAGLNAKIQAAALPSGSLSIGLKGAWGDPVGDGFYLWGDFLSNVFLFAVDPDVTSGLFRPPLESGAQEVAPSPDGSRLLVDGVIYNLDTTHQEPLRHASSLDGPACWFPDGSAVVTSTEIAAGGPVQLFRASSGVLFAHLQTPLSPTNAVACSAGSADKWVAAGDAGGNVVIRLAGGTLLPLSGHNNVISAITSSPNGRYLATASDDGTARIWDASTGRLISILAGDGAPLSEVQFGPGGGLALTVDSRGLVRIWDTGLGEPVTELQRIAHGQTVAFGFTDDGQRVFGANLVSSVGGSAKVTSVSALFWDTRSGRLADKVALPAIASSRIHCATNLSLVGAEAFYSGSHCGVPPPSDLVLTVPVRRPITGYSPLFVELLALTVSPDGRYLAYARARSVALLAADGRRVAALSVGSTPTGLSFSTGGDLIVMTDTAIYVWRPISGQHPVILPQSSTPLDVALSASGERLAAVSASGTVTIWSIPNRTPIRSFHPANTHTASYFSPTPLRVSLSADGNVVASGNANGTVIFWNVMTGKRIAVRTVSTWPIVELDIAAQGPRLLAVDWPQVGTGLNATGTAEVLNSMTVKSLPYTIPRLRP